MLIYICFTLNSVYNLLAILFITFSFFQKEARAVKGQGLTKAAHTTAAHRLTQKPVSHQDAPPSCSLANTAWPSQESLLSALRAAGVSVHTPQETTREKPRATKIQNTHVPFRPSESSPFFNNPDVNSLLDSFATGHVCHDTELTTTQERSINASSICTQSNGIHYCCVDDSIIFYGHHLEPLATGMYKYVFHAERCEKNGECDSYALLMSRGTIPASEWNSALETERHFSGI